MAQDVGGVLVTLLDAFKISDTPERLAQLLDLLVREQLLIRDQLLPSMTDPARFQKQGRIGLKIWPRGQRDAATLLLVHKRWEVARVDAQQTFNTAGYLAFLLSPAVRGIVRLVGYDYEFIEPKVAEDDKPKIVLVGG
jgi:hypothetical protein